MKNFLTVIFCALTFWVAAQPENAVVETINGKKYYVHFVEQGNTLYGIQTLYKTKMESILQANPGLNNNLTIGQKILIPVETVTTANTTEHYGTHIVSQGETLYGISKKYSCTVDQLKALNPGVEAGLSIGQKLNIPIKETLGNNETIQNDPVVNNTPNYNITYSDSIVKHTVLEHETLYSISKRYMISADTIQKINNLQGVKVKKGDVLIIPVKKVEFEIVEKQIDPVEVIKTNNNSGAQLITKTSYNVALVLPLMLAQNEAEMNKPLKVDQVRELLPLTKMSFEFYQGFVFAADSLTKAGLDVKIYVYDTKKDSAAIEEIFKKEEFGQMDLVVGPMFQSETDVVSRLCIQKNIPLILPFKTDAAVLNQNQKVFKTVSSNMTLFDGAVDFILEHYSHYNVLIVKPTSTSDLAIYERCRERYNNGIKAYTHAMNPQIVEVTAGSTSGRDIDLFIKKDTVNIVLVPSENIKFVAGMMTRLNSVMNSNYRSSKMKVVIFGIEDWNRYEDLDMMHKNKLYNHYATYRYVDFNSGPGLEFVKAYRSRYGTDPTVFSSQGFDIGMYFLGALKLYGTDFGPFLSDYKTSLVQNDFSFVPVSEGSGYENKKVHVVMYRNYELVRLD
ncbi:MAG: LysM peptidoglycan-binding domain-containing protein [Crocinitomicaceae bacterium]|nr:LysM peptidoglycan-binding domain-containing protein [Crocinitomicaceae bacterium]